MTEAQQPPAVISVMLIVPDADAAVAWYKRAQGATELWDLGGVAGLEVEGAPFFLHQVNPDNPAEDSPDQVGITSTRIELFVDDPDGFRERASAAGASPGSEVEDHEHSWGTHRQVASAIHTDTTGQSATVLHSNARCTRTLQGAGADAAHEYSKYNRELRGPRRGPEVDLLVRVCSVGSRSEWVTGSGRHASRPRRPRGYSVPINREGR